MYMYWSDTIMNSLRFQVEFEPQTEDQESNIGTN